MEDHDFSERYWNQVEALEDLYRLLAINIVEYPEKLSITSTETLSAYIIAARAAESDYGRLIGSGARMHKSCQQILRSSIFGRGEKVDLVIDCPGLESRSFSKFKARTDWGTHEDDCVASLLKTVASNIFKQPTVTPVRISHSATKFTLFLNEAMRQVECEAIDVWFTAAGRNKGHMVYMDVV